MVQSVQLSFLGDDVDLNEKKTKRSGTFIDNNKLPVHQWFKYSAGFSAEWVESVIKDHKLNENNVVLDPFAGSGTTNIAADHVGVRSFGVEAHPFVSRIAKSKLLWNSAVIEFQNFSKEVLQGAKKLRKRDVNYPPLIHKCYSDEILEKLDRLRRSWEKQNDGSDKSELTWLVLTSILRVSSSAGTAQWQYVLPNKTKKKVTDPFDAFELKIQIMVSDMMGFQRTSKSLATILPIDARQMDSIPDSSIDIVITSPPYANNYDYADATRLEMSFWGEIESWGDLHDSVRKYLICSNSQHASKEKLQLEELYESKHLYPIKEDLVEVCNKLSEERLLHGGKKHYHTMIAAYFLDLSRVWQELARVCKKQSTVCFVIGDSAPYGIYVPVEKWFGRLSIAAGFESFSFEKLRDRNIKWKNRKHRVPLHEGRLWLKR
jgi:DNA modification methylase